MDFETREQIIHEQFIRKMGKMYLPPQSCKTDNEAKQMYGQELRRIINGRLSADMPNADVFAAEVGKVWDKCVAVHDFRIWFTPSLVAKQATKVNAEYSSRQKKVDATWERLSAPITEQERPHASKEDAAANGWTLEKCDQHIADMEAMMERGEINRYLGQRLIGIPMKAKERLINACNKSV